MAGAGVRVFQAGEVLTATLVNTYLQDQVVARFASAAVRDAAFGGAGEPTLEEGRVCYLDSTNSLQYYSGSAWVSISSEAITGEVQAKGDLVVGTGLNTISRVAVGANDTTLVADSTTATGVAWKAPPVAVANSITSAQIVTGTIVDANISASAAIALSKLATGALPTAITVTSANISDLSIVNADVNASAAIALTKLATGTVASVVVHNASGVPTATELSGDVTVNSSGVTAISSGVIVDADISASASISLSKLATGALPTAITVTSANISDLSIVNADISASAAIAYSKLSLGTSIVNADINASAAIAASKISGTAITAADSGTVTSTMIADGTIVNADVNAAAAIDYSKLSLSNAITTTDLATGAARSGFRSHIVTQQGATHTIVASDVGGLVVLSSCTSVVIPTSDATFTVGDRIDFLQTGSQVVTFSATSPQTVGGFDAQTKLGGQYAVATLVKYAANTWVLVGNITS